MGAYVRACALVDGQDVIDIYAIVGGHNYNGDAITGSTAFDPYLEPRSTPASGTSCWLVLDIPARHGQLVLRDLDGHKVGPGNTDGDQGNTSGQRTAVLGLGWR